ncbi:hypothetical protein TREPR_1724 [Treponema primitia ZAS-2]|uniref:Uncharacterized protein n=1 Tax=Treponema primitia (strain ATCC BAA-887 / DSM 12427 / ZAS-2) TaxID=545694 RepID=F5YMU6_TREPZ|nr:hypothetical protein TREPR_1724 [Treponema primitia ZAS-2]
MQGSVLGGEIRGKIYRQSLDLFFSNRFLSLSRIRLGGL